MKPGVFLTPRDFTLLSDCYRQIALSHSQIRDRHFQNRSAPTAKNRIRRLKQAGYLAVFPVAHVQDGRGGRPIGVVYQVTRKAIAVLKSYLPRESFRDDPVRLNPFTLSHDLLLTDVMSLLQRRFPDYKLVHGKLLLGESSSKKRQPDAVLFSPAGNPEIALELELTSKSQGRYREIILDYRLAQAFPKVLYVTAIRSIAEKIQALIAHKPVPGLPEPSTGKFYFALLQDLLSSPRTITLSNGESDIQAAPHSPTNLKTKNPISGLVA